MESGLGLQWKCPSLGRLGKLRLPSERLSSNDLTQLQSSPLYWETDADGLLRESDELINGNIKKVLKLKTTATNRTLRSYENVKVDLLYSMTFSIF